MSKKQKGAGDDVARTLSILNKPLSERIDEILGEVEVRSDPCYDSNCCSNCGGGYVEGRYEASVALAKLFRQYLQAELQRRGITEVIQ